MHPILFRIPLPKSPLKLWWGLVAVIVIAVVYAGLAFRKGDKRTSIVSLVVAAGAGGAIWKWKHVTYQAPNIPIYSYGVMLGLSLVVGWYLTLGLCERWGLPKETMANCYVITALAAIAGSRILYVLTNIPEFEDEKTHEFVFGNIFALRKGGLVAYGGFIGGFVGSWVYLASKKIRLLPWADAAVPSLASGLLITRIGCYLFGCDFGTRLPAGAPGWLKRLGTFPEWQSGTLDGGGGGSPAYIRHLELFRGGPLEQEILSKKASLPVHPTQLYESLVGLALLALLLWQRKNIKFRGQLFFLFVFAYGVARFLLEIIRDDVERGVYGPSIEEHIMIPGCLMLLAVGFTFGISLGIQNQRTRMIARVAAFVPAIAAFIKMKPASFAKAGTVQLSTSQWIALITALLVSYFYAQYWTMARKTPAIAMSLGEFEPEEDKKAKKKDEEEKPVEDEEEEEEEDEKIKEKAKAKDKGGGEGAEPTPEAT